MPLYETHLQSEESPGMIFVKETCLSKVVFLNSVEERRAHGITTVHLVSQLTHLNSVEERRAHGITRVHLVSQFNTFE